MSAPKTYFHSSKGRHKAAARKVPDVERVPCDIATTIAGTTTTHELVNDRWGRTSCAFCGASWAALDAAAREAS